MDRNDCLGDFTSSKQLCPSIFHLCCVCHSFFKQILEAENCEYVEKESVRRMTACYASHKKSHKKGGDGDTAFWVGASLRDVRTESLIMIIWQFSRLWHLKFTTY